jgi:hypothetical protein
MSQLDNDFLNFTGKANDDPGGRTDLYRLYNAYGQLLYVGISYNALTRFSTHSGDKEWWQEVHDVTITHYDDRVIALCAEYVAIRTEHPRYNIMHNTMPSEDRGGPYEDRAIKGAGQWLLTYLTSYGATTVDVVRAEAEADGIPSGCLNAARRLYGIIAYRDGFQGPAKWSVKKPAGLPIDSAADAAERLGYRDAA